MRRGRSIFGPFRRTARTGVPADHFRPARELTVFGDGERVLVASGVEAPPRPMALMWFATTEARDAWVAEVDEWMGDCLFTEAADWDRWEASIAKHGGQLDEMEGGATASVALRPPELAAEAEPPAEADSPELPRSAMSKLSEEQRRSLDGDNEITDPEKLSALVASVFERLGGQEAWEAKRKAKGLTAAVGVDGIVTAAPWHAFLCVEGIRTDDGRELLPGACRFPDMPVSLRLLVEDEGGHWGAVTCGRADMMERRPMEAFSAIYSEGMFGSDPNGQLAELLVEEQTQRFVSIDPRDATAEWVEVEISVDGCGGSYDCWLRISDCVIGAATIVAMPALQQAVITLASVPLPETPIANAAAPPSLPVPAIQVEVEVEVGSSDDDDMTALAASAAPAAALPPAEWFDDPTFRLGDPRLVLQDDEKSYACPLTVEAPDPKHGGLRRVYGHVAWWECKHTALGVKPPHSASGYSHYNTGPGVECEGGQTVKGVGNVTMGTGHAPTWRIEGGQKIPVMAAEAIAHYDGGYGAVQVFSVRAGEDAFGPWIAGYVRPEVTDAQLSEAMTLNPSGDWREIAGDLDLIACLMVPVPGYPVKRALTAAGVPELEPWDTRVGIANDRVFALVAAGIVRRVPDQVRIARLEQTVADLSSKLTRQEALTRPLAVAAIRARAGR